MPMTPGSGIYCTIKAGLTSSSSSLPSLPQRPGTGSRLIYALVTCHSVHHPCGAGASHPYELWWICCIIAKPSVRWLWWLYFLSPVKHSEYIHCRFGKYCSLYSISLFAVDGILVLDLLGMFAYWCGPSSWCLLYLSFTDVCSQWGCVVSLSCFVQGHHGFTLLLVLSVSNGPPWWASRMPFMLGDCSSEGRLG